MNSEQQIIISKLRSQGIGYVKIGQAIGISHNTVRSYCRRNGLDSDTAKNTAACQQCGKMMKIIPKRKPKKFCSDACRTAWWNSHPEQVQRKAVYHFTCVCCGKEFTAYGNQNRKYCSHNCYIADRFGKERVCDE